jgi:hypothetical protein
MGQIPVRPRRWNGTVRLRCDGCRGAVGAGGPEPEVGQDLFDDLWLLDEGNDPHELFSRFINLFFFQWLP